MKIKRNRENYKAEHLLFVITAITKIMDWIEAKLISAFTSSAL